MLVPLGDRLVIRRDTTSKKSTGGVELVTFGKEKHAEESVVGEVLNLSSIALRELGGKVQVGAKVLISPYAGFVSTMDGREVVVVGAGDVLALVVDDAPTTGVS